MKNLNTYIYEALEELYHFTNVSNAIRICNDDTFDASEDDGYNPNGYDYYISTTRQRNTTTGYTTGMIDAKIVRFVLDGRKLNSKFKITPLDWGHDKTRAIKATWDKRGCGDDFDRYYDSIMLQTNVESEDRVLINIPKIKGFHKYIKAIHLDETTIKEDEISTISKYCKKYNIELKIFSHKKFVYGR